MKASKDTEGKGGMSQDGETPNRRTRRILAAPVPDSETPVRDALRRFSDHLRAAASEADLLERLLDERDSAPVTPTPAQAPLSAADDDLWDVERVAKFLGISVHSVYKKAESNEIPNLKIGARRRFDPTTIRNWALRHTQQQPGLARRAMS